MGIQKQRGPITPIWFLGVARRTCINRTVHHSFKGEALTVLKAAESPAR
jgi:hypothetical protein